MKVQSEFIHLAERAAGAEQAENFREAAFFWQEASMLARFSVNSEWATARKNFCEQQIISLQGRKKFNRHV
ncbi:ANR family transcriptional regulator [Lelliottia amnigena]|uniref:ANR family transcriptional regulator n=1 Tax=Lelliottia amnigena TaxID=61646 RepID=A0AAP2AHU9_LELAM|nr:ANR family transcriptional regulator [Enterobacter sp. JMULE2]MBL5901449.1 ANR family transcriptional regulator [Lelliottia amnigena]MBL5936905.1 ANR family transcriptional regulator [Lelliottia amnigena]